MDDRRPGIFLIDLPHPGVVPTEYLWLQCGFHGLPPQQWPLNARLPEDARVAVPHR